MGIIVTRRVLRDPERRNSSHVGLRYNLAT
jgi:hypothetical protein